MDPETAPALFRAVDSDELIAAAAHLPSTPPPDAAGFVLCDLVFEGADTNEGLFIRRRMRTGAFQARPMPHTLFDQPNNAGHYDAVAVGAITRLWRVDMGGGVTTIKALAWVNGTEAGHRAFKAIREGERSFLSADPIAREVHTSYEDTTSTETYRWVEYDPDTQDVVEVEKTVVLSRAVYDFADMVLYGATLLPVAGAFAGARATIIDRAQYDAWQRAVLPDLQVIDDPTLPSAATITASGVTAAGTIIEVPADPPRAAFYRPEASQLTKLTVDGYEVYGHLAGWDMCHEGCQTQCIRPPRGADYDSKFHRTPRPTSDGRPVLTGPITVGTRHARAASEATIEDAIRHHEDTGTAVADVRVVDGKFGPWISGVLRASATPAQIEQLRFSHPSGEWRGREGRFVLHGTLMVNNPAYPIVERDAAVAASGAPVELAASGCGGQCAKCSCATAAEPEPAAVPVDDAREAAKRQLAARQLAAMKRNN